MLTTPDDTADDFYNVLAALDDLALADVLAAIVATEKYPATTLHKMLDQALRDQAKAKRQGRDLVRSIATYC